MFMEMPEAFEKHFVEDGVVELKKTICSLKQSARAHHHESVRVAKFLKHKRNAIGPHVFFKWTSLGLLIVCP